MKATAVFHYRLLEKKMSKEERKATAIKGGRLIDGTGAQPIENAIDIHMFPIEWVKERKVFSINSLNTSNR